MRQNAKHNAGMRHVNGRACVPDGIGRVIIRAPNRHNRMEALALRTGR